ncbi:MAG: cytochrome c maturation protein CcmE [Bacteroidetes bacterium]|nr:cytochrome c maturation protein CcmE [Bacteroidota bacterium]MBP7398261.1 cytochrome c maturation protein CcmE [Chitinophagales bacterium]MBK7109781.1 cytochrome c maturation protein CcmE [Bacteroidota bacterium]MBK8487486.1 cytochrome c maturation protein CcmE [Bacteroidota bacterium]MBK8682772.1 cytochrome c maturation protein CcmE [Bacteroidota bacterium]
MKRSHIILLLFLAICIGVLASQLGNVSAYSDFDDAGRKAGKELRLKGTLNKEMPVDYDPIKDPNTFSFYLVDQNGISGKVVCFDEKPRDFERSDEVVLTGSMKEDVFYANDILVKCPSKYVETEVDKSEI